MPARPHDDRIEALYGAVRDLLGRVLPAAHRDWLALLPEAPVPRRVPPAGLPVLAFLPQARAAAARKTQALVDEIAALAGSLPWGQPYGTAEFGAAFPTRSGFMELIGPLGPFVGADIACGFLAMAPDTEYPEHRHEAEEIYVVLSGNARWRAGTEAYAPAPPGAVLHRAPWAPHATLTDAEPLLALYLWRGGGLTQKAAPRSGTAAPPSPPPPGNSSTSESPAGMICLPLPASAPPPAR